MALLGLFLGDLTFLHEALKKEKSTSPTVSDRTATINQFLNDIETYQTNCVYLLANSSIGNLTDASSSSTNSEDGLLKSMLTKFDYVNLVELENEHYKTSYTLEPRNMTGASNSNSYNAGVREKGFQVLEKMSDGLKFWNVKLQKTDNETNISSTKSVKLSPGNAPMDVFGTFSTTSFSRKHHQRTRTRSTSERKEFASIDDSVDDDHQRSASNGVFDFDAEVPKPTERTSSSSLLRNRKSKSASLLSLQGSNELLRDNFMSGYVWKREVVLPKAKSNPSVDQLVHPSTPTKREIKGSKNWKRRYTTIEGVTMTFKKTQRKKNSSSDNLADSKLLGSYDDIRVKKGWDGPTSSPLSPLHSRNASESKKPTKSGGRLTNMKKQVSDKVSSIMAAVETYTVTSVHGEGCEEDEFIVDVMEDSSTLMCRVENVDDKEGWIEAIRQGLRNK